MQNKDREVTSPCPRCGQPFALLVGRPDVGHEVDVVGWACDCDLTEDEYEDLCDAAVAAFEAPEGTRDTSAEATAAPPAIGAAEAPRSPAAPRPWWRRLFGGEL